MNKTIIIVSFFIISMQVIAQFTDVSLPGVTGISEGDVKWVDWDNDGDLDILLMGRIRIGENSYSQITEQHRNNGNGTFTKISTNIPNMYESSMDFGDYDRDGDLDVIVSGYYVSGDTYLRTTKIFQNNG